MNTSRLFWGGFLAGFGGATAFFFLLVFTKPLVGGIIIFSLGFYTWGLYLIFTELGRNP